METSEKIGFQRGSFGHKMSKKVAELTQVVHMLFIRNHEREVELDEIKDAYEHEISMIIQDAKSRIEKLEFRIRELERKKKKENEEMATNLNRIMRETQERIESLKSDITEERKESNHLRDLLTQAHKDLEILKHGSTGMSGDLLKTNKILEEREREYQRLRKSYDEMEIRYLTTNKQTDALKHQLELAIESAGKNKQVAERHAKATEEKNKVLQEIIKRNKLYEDELKSLRRELNMKKKQSKSESTSPTTDSSNAPTKALTDFDRIKRENEWLRNELKNREGNFNRVFANFQPVFVGANSSCGSSQPDVRESDMMMVTPTSSYSQNGRAAASVPESSVARKPPLNLTGLDTRSRSGSSISSYSRPSTQRDRRSKQTGNSDNWKADRNFRLVFTK